MTYAEFIATVAEHAGLDRDEAEPMTRAVLTTLAERISGGEARDLAAQLPAELSGPLLSAEEEAESFDLLEFEDRTAARAGLTRHQAETGVPAVLLVLREALEDKEFDDMMVQLPDDFRHIAVK